MDVGLENFTQVTLNLFEPHIGTFCPFSVFLPDSISEILQLKPV